MNRLLVPLRIAVLVILLPWPAAMLHAAPDDTVSDGPPNAQVGVQQVGMNVEMNFNHWLFPGDGDPKKGRERIQTRLELQMDEMNRVCELSDAQKQKLRLAARGDEKQFFDEVETLRKKFAEANQNDIGRMWQEVQPLQRRQSAGLFGDKSLFARTLRTTLTDEQFVRYDEMLLERRRFRYRATIEIAMDTLEGTVPLKKSQREAIINCLYEKTSPPLLFGHYDYMLVMYRLSSLAEKDVKPLLDTRQWTLLQQQMNPNRMTKPTLVQNGVIDADDRN